MAVLDSVGPVLAQSLVWLAIIFAGLIVMGAVGFFGMILYRIMRYRVSVDVYEHVGEGMERIRGDMAEEVMTKKEGKTQNFLRLLKNGKLLLNNHIPMPESKYFFAYGNRKKINLHLQDGLATPMMVTHNSPANLEYDAGLVHQLLQSWDNDYAENLETHRKPESFWVRNQEIILFGSMLMAVIVMMFVLVWQLRNLNIVVDVAQTIR